MFMRMSVFSIFLMLCLGVPSHALAEIWQESANSTSGKWEELFNATSGEVAAKVEMDKYTFKKRLITGEKIINAHLKMFYREGIKTVQSTGDYEVYCTTRRVFRSNLKMKAEDIDNTKTTVTVANKMMLEGKEYQDFTGLMDILCAR